jgi:FkbM family methyltransferase
MRWDAKTVQGRFLRWPLRLIPEGAVLPVLSGPLRGARWVVGSAPHGAWLGMLERSKLRIFQSSLEPGMVVWDIGANVGLYTLCSSFGVGASGRVYAFEPMPENLTHLRAHLELNGIENVEIESKAVIDRETVVRMKQGDSPSEWHLDTGGEYAVQSIALDSWLARSAARRPHVLKIDVEGAEVAVLRGAVDTLRRHRPLIYLSLHGETQRLESRELLQEVGYRLRSWEPAEPTETTSEWIAEARA